MTGHAGFDCDQFPGLPMMAKIFDATNLAWVAYYLPAPSHLDRGWCGQRAALVAQGCGQAVVYVGQQVVGPGSHIVTADQGAIDGADAAEKMQAEGFPAGSCCYLDLENGLPFGDAQCAYVQAWAAAFTGCGFKPGVYCSHDMAQAVSAAVPAARIWAFKVDSTDYGTFDGTTFPNDDPAGSGYPGAYVWQCADEARLTAFGGLQVDLDTSVSLDPSAP